MTATTWRDERRKDRAAQAQIDRDDEAARSKLRAAERKAAQDRKLAASRAKAARRAERAAWCAAHAADLMLAPVIAASLVLSWTGMASYGTRDYGLTGIVLPVISEGGAWAFAFAAAFAARTDDPRLWAFRIGVIVFAGAGAALNFLHGLAHGGPTVGATMAIVSVAGITAHQLIKAGPQKTRAERHDALVERRLAQRTLKARMAAVDATPLDVPEAAAQPETETGPTPGAATPEPPKSSPREAPKAVTVAVNNGPHGTLALSFIPRLQVPSLSTSPDPANEQVTPPIVTADTKAEAETPEPRREPSPKPRATARRGRGNRPDKVAQLIAKGGLTNAQIAAKAGVSLSTVERRQREAREVSQASSAVVSLDDRRRA